MRTPILAALIGIAITGCSEPLPSAEGKSREDVRKLAAQAMCSEHPETKAAAISQLARAQDELEARVGGAVEDELSAIRANGCPQWAKAPDEAVQFADKFVKEQVANEQAAPPAQIVNAKNAATATTSTSEKAAE